MSRRARRAAKKAEKSIPDLRTLVANVAAEQGVHVTPELLDAGLQAFGGQAEEKPAKASDGQITVRKIRSKNPLKDLKKRKR